VAERLFALSPATERFVSTVHQWQSARCKRLGVRRAPRKGMATVMTLNFPNRSRSFDSTRRAVRFWGYDTAMEASFFITEDALKQVQPDMRFDEAGLLNAFDTNRELIYATASKVYARGRKGSYDLHSTDF
jgi:Protein of unknown function (DUF1488)